MSILTILFFILLLFGAAGCIISLKHRKEWLKEIDKKEHKLYFLYPMVDFLLSKTRLDNYFNQKSWIADAGKALTVANKIHTWQKLYWYRKVSLVMVILYLFFTMAFLSRIQAGFHTTLIDGNYLERPAYGEGDQEVHLTVAMDPIHGKEIEKGEELSVFKDDLTLRVEEQSYRKEELEKRFQDSIAYLEIAVLGENESASAVDSDLIFYKNIPGTSILVDWKPEDPGLIGRDGIVRKEGIPPDGLASKVKVILSYQEEQREYSMEFYIMPKRYSQEEEFRMRLEEEVATASVKTKDEPWFKLPDEIDGYPLRWMEMSDDRSIMLFGLGVVTAILVWIYKDKELEKRMKHRKNQMLLDYPEIINKFNLLIHAGMTVKQAWSKIAEDYKIKKKEGCIGKRYAYEEMLLTVSELRLNIAEINAYEAFGRRTGLLPYMKFSTLIAQNLKKGNSGLCEILNNEAQEAFENRKETAKRLGEEAGIKLLGPMMVMLIIVFLIILIPAFLSFAV